VASSVAPGLKATESTAFPSGLASGCTTSPLLTSHMYALPLASPTARNSLLPLNATRRAVASPLSARLDEPDVADSLRDDPNWAFVEPAQGQFDCQLAGPGWR
jgi:hypothetical protein